MGELGLKATPAQLEDMINEIDLDQTGTVDLEGLCIHAFIHFHFHSLSSPSIPFPNQFQIQFQSPLAIISCISLNANANATQLTHSHFL